MGLFLSPWSRIPCLGYGANDSSIVQSIVQSMDPFLCQVSLANKKQPSCISRTSRKRGSCKWTEICGRVAFEMHVKKSFLLESETFHDQKKILWKKGLVKERPHFLERKFHLTMWNMLIFWRVISDAPKKKLQGTKTGFWNRLIWTLEGDLERRLNHRLRLFKKMESDRYDLDLMSKDIFYMHLCDDPAYFINHLSVTSSNIIKCRDRYSK